MVSTIDDGHYRGWSMGQIRHRRWGWDDDKKRRSVAQTQVPGVSVSQMARRYDVNANLAFRWLRDARFMPTAESAHSKQLVEQERKLIRKKYFL